MRLDELKATLDSFSPVKIEFVARVMESLANPPNTNIRSRGTWLTSEPDWIEYFGLALSVHHGATTEPLGLSSFETVLPRRVFASADSAIHACVGNFERQTVGRDA